eukprot:CAMPEP_0113659014 /NCGR_PEP_ID=MMETSP0017_2-20120614/32092_1 /TAXON_ID=2856 /ORGANISM="Cylindrotheca closterium" /LENGTH=653 /DNA_ID=CAMNT_0000573457 /DNA_START=20 /DNA_END=1981 /DNA_ORIENTATION=+ /assembly_acc=CAM_ASM_000147
MTKMTRLLLATTLISLTNVALAQPYYDYTLQGQENCAMVNIAMDESGSMVDEHAFMRTRAAKKLIELLESPGPKFQKVFLCSNGFGNNNAIYTDADADGFRHIGCSLGYDQSILNWNTNVDSRTEDGYSATTKSIDRVPAVIGGVDLAQTCGMMAKNMILVTDEDRDAVTAVTKEDVKTKLADTGYIYNIIVNVFINSEWSDNIIGMRYNYKLSDYTKLATPVTVFGGSSSSGSTSDGSSFGPPPPSGGSSFGPPPPSGGTSFGPPPPSDGTYVPPPGGFVPPFRRNLQTAPFVTYKFYTPDVPNELFAVKEDSNGGLTSGYMEFEDPGRIYPEVMTNGHGLTIEDYGEIIENTRGAIFSIRTLRKGHVGQGGQVEISDAFAAALVDIKVCEMTRCRQSEIGGDPHITTWKDEHYEFHGQCDLVLAKDPDFAEGMGLDVHIRTKIVRYWSYIQSAAIRIGDDILEIQGGTEMNTEAEYWINFEHLGDLTTFAGFPVIQESNKIHRRSYTIDLNSKYPGKKIVIDLYREFVRVKLGGGLDIFGNTVGLLGDPRSGDLLARDGVTSFDDYIDFGNEWQVLPSDGRLFRELAHPHFPERCLQPEDPQGDRRRRLAESSISIEQAEAACASLKDPLTIKDCVYDVLATQDLDMIGAF